MTVLKSFLRAAPLSLLLLSPVLVHADGEGLDVKILDRINSSQNLKVYSEEAKKFVYYKAQDSAMLQRFYGGKDNENDKWLQELKDNPLADGPSITMEFGDKTYRGFQVKDPETGKWYVLFPKLVGPEGKVMQEEAALLLYPEPLPDGKRPQPGSALRQTYAKFALIHDGKLVEQPLKGGALKAGKSAGTGGSMAKQIRNLDEVTGRTFDGSVDRGGAVKTGGDQPAQTPEPGKLVAPPETMNIANKPGESPPAEIGEVYTHYWDHNELKDKDHNVVGYKVKGTGIVFYHGGAAPGKEGYNEKQDDYWTLYSAETGKQLGGYGSLDLVRTDDQGRMKYLVEKSGLTRLDLHQLISDDNKDRPKLYYWKSSQHGSAENLGEMPSAKDILLLRERLNPQDPMKLRSYRDLSGRVFKEYKIGDDRYVVADKWTPPAEVPAPDGEKTPLPAPKPEETKPEKVPEKVAALVAAIESGQTGPKRRAAIAQAYAAVKDDPAGAEKALTALAGKEGLPNPALVDTAKILLDLFPSRGDAAEAAVAALRRVLKTDTPAYFKDAVSEAKRSAFGPELVAKLQKDRQTMERLYADRKAESKMYSVAPVSTPDPSWEAAVALLKKTARLPGDAIKARNDVLVNALAHKDPGIRKAAAAALGDLGEFSRDARHALAAAAVTDLNPDVRKAAAVALSKVDKDDAAKYGILPELGAAPKKETPTVRSSSRVRRLVQDSPLVKALKTPASERDRNTAVNAMFQELRRLRKEGPQDRPELQDARKDLAKLLTHEQEMTRVEAAGALLIISPDNRDAIDVLLPYTRPDSKAPSWMRSYAISGLNDVAGRDGQVVENVTRALRDDRDKFVRGQAFATLMYMYRGRAEQEELFAKHMEEQKDPYVRGMAFWMLMSTQTDQAKMNALGRKYTTKYPELSRPQPPAYDPFKRVLNPFELRTPGFPFTR